MQHIGFQLFSLKSWLHRLDDYRYTYQIDAEERTQVQKSQESDYNNPENILNRIQNRISFSGQFGLGCALGLGFSVTKEVYESINGNNVVEFNTQFSNENEEENIYFICGNLQYNPNDTNSSFYGHNFYSKFILSKGSKLLTGANIQLGDNSDLVKTNNPNIDYLSKYIEKALEVTRSITTGDMNEKNHLIKDLLLLHTSVNGFSDIIFNSPEINFPSGTSTLDKLGFSIAKCSLSKVQGSNELYNNNIIQFNNNINEYGAITNQGFMELLIPLLKQVNGASGYDLNSNDPFHTDDIPFTPYLLMISIGEEGVDDNCCVDRMILGGEPIKYKHTWVTDLNKAQASVTITPLPRNRAKVIYTISAVPNGATGITFKANF